MKKKMIGRVLMGGLLLTILAVGIHILTIPPSDAGFSNTSQMSRIDFKEPIDSTTAFRIRNTIQSINGVQHAYFNIKDGIVVYAHDIKTVGAQEVYETIQSEYALHAERYIVTAEMAASGCPVTGHNSIFVKANRYFRSLIP